jgi:ribose 5-phosphate isomerase RpiB
MKEYLKSLLHDKGYEVVDFGAYSSDSMDYPDTAHPLAGLWRTRRLTLALPCAEAVTESA